MSDVLFLILADWNSTEHHGQVQRQLSVSSDSKLLDDDIREESRVIMRPKKPPRPKSEVFLNKHNDPHPRRKRFSAFGVSQGSVATAEFWLLHKRQNRKLCLAQLAEAVNIYIFITMIHCIKVLLLCARSKLSTHLASKIYCSQFILNLRGSGAEAMLRIKFLDQGKINNSL